MHRFIFVVILSLFFRVTSLALWQSYILLGASEAALENVGKYMASFHTKQNKAKQIHVYILWNISYMWGVYINFLLNVDYLNCKVL